MSRTPVRITAAFAAIAAVALTGCAGSTSPDAASDAAPAAPAASDAFPTSITHALGTTTIDAQPERVATIAWGNQDVALALGVVPVGVANQVWSWTGATEPGLYEWTTDAIEALGGETPTIYDETDGIAFEAVADTAPQVILGALSGLSAEDYATLSDIAPTVAYPEIPWYTSWRDQITYNAQALGLADEGDALIADIEQQIADATADAGFEGKSAAFFYASPADLSTISIYTGGDARTALLADLGFDLPQVAIDAMADGAFYQDFSAENADRLADVDVIVTYGGEDLLPALQADPLWSTLPAVQAGAVVAVGDGDAFSAALSPTALSLPWVLDDYVAVLKDAAAKVQ